MTTINGPTESQEWLPLPGTCPDWCSRDHAQYLAEGAEWDDAREHSSGRCGEGYLPEIRNGVDGRIMRVGGASWLAEIRQRPQSARGGCETTASIDLNTVEVADHSMVCRARLRLTSGEARVLARQLIALADALDL